MLVINNFMKTFFCLLLLSTFFLYGCGDEPVYRPLPNVTDETDDSTDDETEDTNPLIEAHKRQREQLLEKYNKILKPNAPLL